MQKDRQLEVEAPFNLDAFPDLEPPQTMAGASPGGQGAPALRSRGSSLLPGRGGARKKGSWDDYLRRGQGDDEGPRPVMSGVLDLQSVDTAAGEEGQGADDPGPGDARSGLTSSEPFIVPAVDLLEAGSMSPIRKLMILSTILSLMWGMLLLSPRPQQAEAALSKMPGAAPSDSYLRLVPEGSQATDAAWLIRVGDTLLVRMDGSWAKEPPTQQLMALRRLRGHDPGAKEILVFDNRSQLMAEVYDDRYHTY